ncbi:MAG: ABC transporter ATP-binding protein [Candidatus Bipolaricaulis sp.]|nr:ABC transporter ATP-binding protein [Candidatus Bipolaricaulis sp.]
MAGVTVEDIRVTYNKGKTVAAADVAFDVRDGEFCVLLGPSGCGKTTVLHCIAGLIRPDSGQVKIGDRLVTDVKKNVHVRPQDRNIAMVFQEYALYPNMTVRRNMAFPLETRKLPRRQIEQKVQQTAELLGIEELLDRKPAQLSGGQRQRVALGRALVRDPDVFLLDEPLGNIDAKLRLQVRFELKRVQRQLGVTMVYVTHDQVEAMAMADKIVLMNEGKIAQVGTPDELYETPKNLFVAGFLGIPPINLFQCSIVRTDHGLQLDAGAFHIPIPPSLCERLASHPAERGILLGVRPSDIEIAEPDVPGAVRAEIEVVEPSGDSVVVHGRIGDLAVTAKWPTIAVSEGEAVMLAIRPDRLHLFDADSGTALASN